MRIRIAAVSFLNTVPLIAGLEEAGPDVTVIRALPSELAGMLEAGQADVALLPVVDVFRGRGGSLVGASGIACRGAVDSVKLFSCSPLSRLERVHVDRGSHTSVALLRVLLAERYGIEPEFVTVAPRPVALESLAPAALVIGDRCFEFDRELGRGGHRAWLAHDLGAMWQEDTGLPFVFASWALAPGLEERLAPAEIARIGRILADARTEGLRRVDELAAAAAAAGRLGRGGEASATAIAYYWRTSLRLELGPEELAGLRVFHGKCVAHGLAPAGPPPLVL